jgi:hypothetical protein
MSPAQNLPLSHYDAVGVLVADEGGAETTGIKITVYGKSFPARALEPEILVGDELATRVSVAPDQRSIRGFLAAPPPDGAAIRVRYGPSQEGELRERFSRARVRPRPRICLPFGHES